MKENYTLQEFYKRRLYGERSMPARALDFLILRALLFLLFFLWLSTRLGVGAPTYVLAFVLVSLLSVVSALLSSIRLDACKRRVNAQLMQEIIRDRILLMPGEAYTSMVNAYCRAKPDAYGADCMIYALQRSEKLNRDALLCVYRAARRRGCKTVALFCPAPVGDDAAALLQRNDVAIIRQGDAVFSAMAEMRHIVPTDAEVRAHILMRIEQEKLERKKNARPFVLGRVRRYWLVGAVLLAASFFVEYSLYYRMMAAACASFASLSWWLEHSAPAQRS